jgi:hypothetical protein
MTRNPTIVLCSVAFWGYGIVCVIAPIATARASALAHAPPAETAGSALGAETDQGGPDGVAPATAQPPDHASDQSTAAPKAVGTQDGALVFYSLQHMKASEAAQTIERLFGSQADVVVQGNKLLIRASNDVHADIGGVITFLDQAAPPAPASADDGPSMTLNIPNKLATQYGYLGLTQRRQRAALERVRVAKQQLAEAKTDDDKKTAREQLRRQLTEIFAEDMAAREQEAAAIEARLAGLRKLYQQREASKDRIIDLQLQVIEQDAAGLGFPGGVPSSKASPTSIRGAGKATPASNLPARRVDEHDPIPQELTLADVKKSRPTVVANMKTSGHFIESKDGKHYAYANVKFPSGPSVIRVVDAATGKLVATDTVNSVAGPLVFTDEGVATRESFNIPHLRVPLKKPPVEFSPRFNSGVAGAIPFDPMAAALDPEFMKEHSANRQTRVGELSARGHFVGSPDGKLYAYVETSGDGIPEGTAEIRVCDARTGQRLAAAKIKAPAGKLRYFNEGVATEDADGTIKLRISFSKDHDAQEVLESTASDDPVTLSETVRREALAMLQGTWNCVAAGSNDDQLSKEQLAALALQLAIKGDEVTISHVGDDLKQHQTAGRLLIDMSTSPPSFHIDIHVAGIQAQSRLSGQTRIDRGVLRMNRPGGTFLIHRKFASEPSTFEFRTPRSDSTIPSAR